jgi:hypothetical protein
MEERAGEANEVLDNKEGKGVKAKSLSYRNIYGYLASACDSLTRRLAWRVRMLEGRARRHL